MKSVFFLNLIFISLNAQAACPDVSGTYAGSCATVRVCDNQQVASPSQTGLSYVITQQACDKISVVTSNSMVNDRDTIYTPDVPVSFTAEKGTKESIMSYSEVHLIRQQKVDSGEPNGVNYSYDSFQKIMSGGLPHLHYVSDTYTGSSSCHVVIDCIIPELPAQVNPQTLP